MTGEQHVWVILCEQGLGYSWTDLAFWDVAETYEAAEKKLRAVTDQNGGGFTASWSKPEDVKIWAGRLTWRIKKVAL
ncbi:hypothetical protein GO986_08680 [Deinococcus sp. HMF7620]|uniref:Uncharacterized protein n=1 Tax=Deinococcus arboris TaxID=2682977 RepID=A0A7C9LLT8_9DEIO|nr:hypothetical protein [Deinococcus arboris]MVN86837.1 hypothetical protein [Deinococcus arboris]